MRRARGRIRPCTCSRAFWVSPERPRRRRPALRIACEALVPRRHRYFLAGSARGVSRARHLLGDSGAALPRLTRACHMRGVFGAVQPRRGPRASHLNGDFGATQPRRASRARHLRGVSGAALPRPARAYLLHDVFRTAPQRVARAFPQIAPARTFLYTAGLSSHSMFRIPVGAMRGPSCSPRGGSPSPLYARLAPQASPSGYLGPQCAPASPRPGLARSGRVGRPRGGPGPRLPRYQILCMTNTVRPNRRPRRAPRRYGAVRLVTPIRSWARIRT